MGNSETIGNNTEKPSWWIFIIILAILSFFVILNIFLSRNKGDTAEENTKDITKVINPEIQKEQSSGQIISGQNTTGELPISYDDFLKMKSEENIYNIINNPIYSSFPKGSDKKSISTTLTDTYGTYIQITNIVHGYLYVVASVNNKSLGIADTVYMMFGNVDGKLDPVDALKYWEEGGKSYFIYSLDKIKFIRYNTDIKRIGSRDLSIIGINSKLYWLGFISTSGRGKLEKVQIIYK